MPISKSNDPRQPRVGGLPSRMGNKFLDILPESDRNVLLPHVRELPLLLRMPLFGEGDTCEHIFFPVTGMVSVVVDMMDGRTAETGIIGHDGAVGLISGLYDLPTAGRAVVQLPGSALVIPAGRFRSAAADSVAMRRLIGQFEHLFITELMQTVACNALHNVDERICTWLLRSHDMCRGGTINLTQEFLAQMLGVRRTTVTISARLLQHAGVIRYSRGHVNIVDRQALERQACECYHAMHERKRALCGMAL